MIRQIGNYQIEYGTRSCIITGLSHSRYLKDSIVADYEGLPEQLPNYVRKEIKKQLSYLGTLYLLHFDKPYKHAAHYLGFTKGLDARLAAHGAGKGANLVRVIQAAGIGYSVHILGVGDRYEERRLKKHSSSRYCPECKIIRPRLDTHPLRMIA